MKRQIIRIDEATCNGCGMCATGCPEGAIQIVEGKARLVGEILCDGLGACIGECPVGAISVEEREAEPYDERRVLANIAAQGPAVLEAHLLHLQHHGQEEYLRIAREEMAKLGLADPTGAGAKPAAGCGCGGHGAEQVVRVPLAAHAGHLGGPMGHAGGGCPGSKNAIFARGPEAGESAPAVQGPARSELGHWPVQMHLMSPGAPQYRNADVVLAADCVAYALADFHQRFLKGKALAIACPKLDDGLDEYEEKILALVDQAQINTLTVIVMEVPCCRGLVRLAQSAVARASRKVPLKLVVVGVSGELKGEQWI